ncbi:hypothetical protein [Hymenobacter cellulosilyticus]|uniref:Bulb-type lectin domain-containing protein n=1 Tax=Hymenobacter cellulosilyticus TaxID=2932248 RepID=A0A8T9Q4G1_9BACT|nr:hypothetical protein [Hymenobacter cellulosilyticus]UOQ70369.1 hypothetical protein MUN79_16665 [Hymenobacter cellulosilyticus]
MNHIYKGTLLFLACLASNVLPARAQAQKEVSNWYFGNQAGVSFAAPTPVATTGAGMTSYEGSACISDAAGQVLMYSNGEQIWDASHQVMPNGNSLGDIIRLRRPL